MIDWVVRKKYFKNANHAIWFLTTSSFAGLMLVYYIKPKLAWLWVAPILVFHISPIIKSLKVIRKKENSDLYSKDCVWFNFLMIGFYVCLWLVVIK